jgi:CheY-like chemotaxis protein
MAIQKLQIVMVEDLDTDAEFVTRRLIKAGIACDIHRVQTEPDFTAALRGIAPDLILSDFSLPQFSGMRALEIAAERAPEIPFIFVSGTIGEERAIEAMHRGATDYVLKTNLARLPAVVERALHEVSLKAEQRRSEQQRRDQEVRLQRLMRSYRMLSNTSSAILRLRNRTELLDEVCRIAVQAGGYDRVSISLIDPGANILRLRAWAGTDSEALRAVDHAVLNSEPASPGMAERAIGSGAPAVQNDLVRDRQPAAHCDLLIAQGYRALAALPLNVDGTPIGAISLFSDQREIFDEAEIGVLL